ncbi:unnamed protein product [Brassica rapa subsp. narinosa]
MANPSAVSEDRKLDDLEIASVGVLYSGYQSSSRVGFFALSSYLDSCDSIHLENFHVIRRGKDRFPYPVGYKAVRAHNESTYYMEIEEGAKGLCFWCVDDSL